ncbi:GTPase IMAP family member 9-like isoform X2 [Mytilus galloprovincialis]|uniref:GTPase IMAP family member 9-like isoform X2 n=1 Tax=Mytilus galloprovincialis TaxID=29158 RepID=UPI003F7C3A8C
MASKEESPSDDEMRQEITEKTKVELDSEIRIVLIGRTGSGKSSTGNTIMNEKYFIAKPSVSSVTKECMIGETKRNEVRIRLVDTPGFFDTNATSSSVKLEILKCFKMLYPGPNIIIYVLRVGRLTEEEMTAVQHFLYLFGGDPFRYTMIVITGRDDLEKEDTTPLQFLQSQEKFFLEFLSKCGNRVIFFNNRSKVDSEGQLEEMFHIIETTIRENAKTSSYYTNEIIENIRSGIYKSSLDRLVGPNVMCKLKKYKSLTGILFIVVGGGIIVISRQFLIGTLCIGGGYTLIKKGSTTPESKIARIVTQLERNNSPCCIS